MFAKLLAAFTVSLCAVASATAAGITNGRFEGGNLNGWTVFLFDRYNEVTHAPPDLWGYAAAVGGNPPFAPLAGAYSAVLAATDYRPTSDCSRDLFNTSCPSYPPTGIPSTPAGGPALAHEPYMTSSYNGAYIGQDFSAHAGDVLTWTWRWDGDAMDMMFAMLTNGASAFYLEGRAFGGFFAQLDPVTHDYLNYRSFTGLSPGEAWNASFPISADGLWTIYFGIAQTGDNMGPSWMRLDDVRVAEPATAALVLVGLLGLLIDRRAHPRRLPDRRDQ